MGSAWVLSLLGLSCLLGSLVPGPQFTLLTTWQPRSLRCLHPSALSVRSSGLTSSGTPASGAGQVRGWRPGAVGVPSSPESPFPTPALTATPPEPRAFHGALQGPRPPGPRAWETQAFLVKGRVLPVPRGSDPPVREVSSPATLQSSARDHAAPSRVHSSDEDKNDS